MPIKVSQLNLSQGVVLQYENVLALHTLSAIRVLVCATTIWARIRRNGVFVCFPLPLLVTDRVDRVELIVRTSYVRFGEAAFHQTTGIPMGVNPGVYLANFYLYQSEFRFFRQFYDLFIRFPPALCSPEGAFPDSAAT
jgi:hypothetical protein